MNTLVHIIRFSARENVAHAQNICRDKGPKSYIGPWTLSENVDWSEDE